VADLERSLELYDRVFELLEFPGDRVDSDGFHEWNDFSVTAADGEHPPTRGVHVAFAAESREQIDRWWRELTAAGYVDDGAPGLRPEYGSTYYGAFIRDLDGNSVEAVQHASATRRPGLIDHLWIRTRDLVAARSLYAALAPVVGLGVQTRGRMQLVAEGATFSVLRGQPTEHLHLAFGVADQATVVRFHEAGLAAGARDGGAPGERPHYRPGYYSAYLLDQDGNNLEAVHHGGQALDEHTFAR